MEATLLKKLFGRDKREAIILYTQPTCADCHAAKSFLTERGVSYTDRDMTADPAAESDLRKILDGRLMTPTLVVGKEILIGFARNRARLEELFPRQQ